MNTRITSPNAPYRALQRLAMRSVVAMCALAAACSDATERTLRVATFPWPGYESLHLAESLGYLDPKTLRLVELVNDEQAIGAMLAGTVDAATLTLDEALALVQDGMDIRVVLIMDVSAGADVVMARPSIADAQGLKGKRVGVQTAAVGAVMLDAVLSSAGLTTDDIQLVSVSVDEQEAAFVQGRIDAVVTYEPVRSKLLRQGAHVIFDSRAVPGRIVDVLVVRTDMLPVHAAAVKQLVAAHFRALDYLRSHPEDAAHRIAPYLNIDPSLVVAQFGGVQLPDAAANKAQLAGPQAEFTKRAGDLAALLYRRQLLRNTVNVEHLADPRFLPQSAP